MPPGAGECARKSARMAKAGEGSETVAGLPSATSGQMTGRWLNSKIGQPREPHLRPHSTRRLAAVLGLLTLALAASPALSQYKWKDNRGQVHVSDLPPPRDVPEKDVLQRPNLAVRPALASPAAAASAASAPLLTSKPLLDPELEARRKRAEDEARARSRADEARLAAQRAENCQRARQQLATIESGQRLVRYNERGERIVLDDAARADEAQAAQRAMAQDCR